jgi:prepilin-type N-terminal cleavage/methylation domain-containing protein
MLTNMELNKLPKMKSGDRGFSLIELLIVMAIFTTVIAISASVFTTIIGPSKQEAKIGEAQLESMVGIQMLISDIQNAGFGLPHTFGSQIVNYAEAAAGNAALFNDAPNGVPRAITGSHILDPTYGTVSHLAVKGSCVAMNATSQRWSQVGVGGNFVGVANAVARDQTQTNDHVIVLNMESDPMNPTRDYRRLVLNAGSFDVTQATSTALPSAVAPTRQYTLGVQIVSAVNVAYGIDTGALRMPFNRADYFINASNVPVNCAPNTGTLTKNTLNHATGAFTTVPIIDCVASFQVFYGLSSSVDSQQVVQFTDNLNLMNAQTIRETLREVRVYILMHEGRRDDNFTYNTFTGATANSIRLGTPQIFWDYSLNANQLNYRWKVLSFIVSPKNL